jgi:hypothetical protein
MRNLWSAELAKYWNHYVPPCRPTRFDLDLAAQFLEQRRIAQNSRPSILVLGSTSEYRDFGFEEGCDVTVADNSIEYSVAASQNRRYKAAEETFWNLDWLALPQTSHFDLVLGDLVVGNIWKADLPAFLSRVSGSLKEGGAFLTKSFFSVDHCEAVRDTAKRFASNAEGRDPFPFLIYSLAMECRDRSTGELIFRDMYDRIEAMVNENILPGFVLSRFQRLGWNLGSKIVFQVLEREAWETHLGGFFSRVEQRIGPYFWSKDFPVYLCFKQGDRL